jgi:thioester reductase-like protein
MTSIPAAKALDWSAYANQPTRSSAVKTLPQLRQYLQAKLPEYMVPSAFVFLKSLPLTPNGKVDRKALPAPTTQQAQRDSQLELPSTFEEKLIADLWREILSLDQIGIHDNFFDLGGHSLRAAELLFKLKKEFEIDLALIHLFLSPTVAEQAKLICDRQSGTAHNTALDTVQLDLPSEAVLASDIFPTASLKASVDSPTDVLLTGATGFLGAFLLDQLLQQTEASVYCLVRAQDSAIARARIIQNLQQYKLWQPSYDSKIIPLVGDLAQPQLGLSDQQLQHLAQTIDIIYHNGSMVNFMYPYPVMKAANVASTEALLRLASQHKIKPVHFISTMGVFSPINYSDNHIIQPQDAADHPKGLYGYTQSKWVAEKLLAIAQSRGIPTTIHRPAWVEGDSQTGNCNQSDFLRSLVKGCLQLGVAPDWQMPVDFTPVDYLSRAIVHLSRRETSAGQFYNFANPHAMWWNQLVDWLNDYGYALEQMPYSDWLALVKAEVTVSSDNALVPYLSFLTELSPEYPMTIPEIYFRTHQLQFENSNLHQDLADLQFPYPSAVSLLPLYFSRFVEMGYLHPPQKSNLNIG